MVGAIKEIASEVTSLEQTVAGFADQLTTRKLCVADDSGAQTCLTKSQIDALLASEGAARQGSGPASISPTITVGTPAALSIEETSTVATSSPTTSAGTDTAATSSPVATSTP